MIDGNFGDYNEFCDFYLNSFLYSRDEEGIEKITKDYLAIQAVGNEEDLTRLIDKILMEE